MFHNMFFNSLFMKLMSHYLSHYNQSVVMTVIQDSYQNCLFRPELDSYLTSGAIADTDIRNLKFSI